jgi:molecular chaperone DnaJ
VDFYIELGIERGAPAGEIKRAYKRLARRLHPDINPGDREAEARFRQVLDAYETLMDPDRRRRYDAGQLSAGNAEEDAETFGFAGFDFSNRVHAERTTTFGELFEEVLSKRAGRPAEGAEQGADIHARATLSFEEAWQGVQRTVTVTRQDTCRACAGSGFQRIAETRCVSCEGTGNVRSVRGHMVFAKTCPTCGGEGRLKQEECAACHGQGVETRSETLSVRIPAAVADGARVRIPGKGHAGVRGGAPGDLLIDVSVAEHPVYRRDGDELHMTVPIAVHEAALGAKIDIETPDGIVRLRVPPGTQSGQKFRLRDRGALTRNGAREGQRGDLVVEVRMRLPKVLDERSKELLREFGRINGESVRPPIKHRLDTD